MDKFIKSFLFLCLSFASLTLSAATVTFADVVRKGRVFYLDSTLEVNVPREVMFKMLVDYDNLEHFSSGFVETKKFEPDSEGVVKVYTHLKGCVTFFCRHIKKMETLETTGVEKITTILIPGESHNVKRIDSHWELSEIQIPEVNGKALPSSQLFSDEESKSVKYTAGTKIRYRMTFQPDFWVPPIIGGYLVKKALVSDGTQILNRMEKYAHRHLLSPHKKAKAASSLSSQ